MSVDSELLGEARRTAGGATDASLIEAALRTYLNVQRRDQIDEQYRAAYSEHPLDEPDEWGDLASFVEAA